MMMPTDPYEAQFAELLKTLRKEKEYPHWVENNGNYTLKKVIRWVEQYQEAARKQKEAIQKQSLSLAPPSSIGLSIIVVILVAWYFIQ